MGIKLKSRLYNIERAWKDFTGDSSKSYHNKFSSGQKEFISFLIDNYIVLEENKVKQEVMEDILHILRSSKNSMEIIDNITKYKTEIDKIS